MIKPSELGGFCRAAGLDLRQSRGMGYNPLTKRYSINTDTSVNYLIATQRPVS
jgi:2-polyprenyl-6-hydroxyphenyl methylase/3-demethylubiquinone-9 3-methyltransferase